MSMCHLHDDFINIVSNKRSLLPRSVTDMRVHIFDPATTTEIYTDQDLKH